MDADQLARRMKRRERKTMKVAEIECDYYFLICSRSATLQQGNKATSLKTKRN